MGNAVTLADIVVCCSLLNAFKLVRYLVITPIAAQRLQAGHGRLLLTPTLTLNPTLTLTLTAHPNPNPNPNPKPNPTTPAPTLTLTLTLTFHPGY